MKKLLLSVIIIVVTLIVTGKNLFSKNIARIVVNKEINLCDSNSKTFIFVVDIGMIEKIDSLYGFDLDIKYDPSKVKILSYLKSNSLSEQFEQSSFSFGADTNHIRGYATTFNFNAPPSYGDSILIGFYAEWIGERNCEDSSLIELVDINFTEEFKKEYLNQSEFVRTSLSRKNHKEIIKATFNVDSVGLEENQQLFNFECRIEYPKIEAGKKLKIQFNQSDTINIKSVSSECADCIKFFENNIVSLVLPGNEQEFTMLINAEYNLADSLDKYIFGIDTIDFYDCNCVGRYEYDLIEITKHITPESINVEFSENGIISLQVGAIFYLYNYEGKLIENKQVLESDSKFLNLNNFQGSVFFLIVEKNINKIEYKKIYKCY